MRFLGASLDHPSKKYYRSEVKKDLFKEQDDDLSLRNQLQITKQKNLLKLACTYNMFTNLFLFRKNKRFLDKN